MIDTSEPHMLIPVWMTSTFIHDDSLWKSKTFCSQFLANFSISQKKKKKKKKNQTKTNKQNKNKNKQTNKQTKRFSTSLQSDRLLKFIHNLIYIIKVHGIECYTGDFFLLKKERKKAFTLISVRTNGPISHKLDMIIVWYGIRSHYTLITLSFSQALKLLRNLEVLLCFSRVHS